MPNIQIGDRPTEKPLVDPGTFSETPTGGVQLDPTKVQEQQQQQQATGDKQKPADEKPSSERPEWLPEKFKTPEDMAKAYSELEKKQSQAKKPSEGSGESLSLAVLAQEWNANKGALSEESKKALQKAGISESDVETYAAGQAARGAQLRSEFANIAGGEEQFKAVIEWGNKNLDKDLADAYTDAIADGNIGIAKILFENIVTKYQAAVGKDPSLITAPTVPGASTGPQPFENWAQVQAEMNNPKYKDDPAFRKQVEQRLAKSKL